MRYWHIKKNPRRERGKRKPDRIGVERWLEQEIKGMIDDPGPRREGSQTSPPLNTPIDQVLMQIKDEEALTFPSKLKGDPNKRPRDKYCRFHRDHSHDTSDCYDLKQQIEALIKQGKLQKFVDKEGIEQNQGAIARRENERPKPLVGDIRMIIGGKYF